MECVVASLDGARKLLACITEHSDSPRPSSVVLLPESPTTAQDEVERIVYALQKVAEPSVCEGASSLRAD